MFDNIGGKLKNLAYTVSLLGIIASIIGAIVLWGQNSPYNSTIATGCIVLVGGCIGSWVGGFFTYGFGELIDQQAATADRLNSLCRIVTNLGNTISAPAPSNTATAPISEVVISANRWTCPKCGQSNPKSRASCTSCGFYK